MLRRATAAAAAAMMVCLAQAMPAAADVVVRIDKSAQRMTVTVDGEQRHVWPISTGRAGFGTPSGHFRPQWMARSWFSRKYYNSPMPYSIFFHRGYAIHGTNYIRRLGGPASHGCVRLHPGNAATLFALVNRHGMRSTRIVVTGANPVAIAGRADAARAKRARAQRARATAPRRDYGRPFDDEPAFGYEPRRPRYYYDYRYIDPYRVY